MKTTLITLGFIASTIFFAGCSEKPLTETQKAEQMGMSMEEYQETKEAAARMNMGIDEHMNMSDEEMEEMDYSNMGM